MKIEDVYRLAKLSRVSISEAEAVKLVSELTRFLAYVSQLEVVDTKGVPEYNNPKSLLPFLREDIAKPFQNIAGILKNGPEVEDNFFKVKKIIE